MTEKAKEFVMCKSCGKPVGPKKQVEELRERQGIDPAILEMCPDCRRKEYALVAGAKIPPKKK